MKIHNCVRDAKLMELAEMQAINNRVRAVHADSQPNEQEKTIEEFKENVSSSPKQRAKKKKERVRSNEGGVLPEA